MAVSILIPTLCVLLHLIRYLEANGSMLITVTPSGTVSVCSGDQLELTCNATAGSQVEWSVYSIPENETIAMRYGRRILNTRAEIESNLTVKSILFTFSRISPLYDLPFVTRLVTSPISNDINGTEVVCTDKVSGNYSSTTVIVISKSWVSVDNQTRNYSLILGDDDGVSVYVAAVFQRNDVNLHYYTITVVPETHFVTRHDTITIKMLYNTFYNISIIHMCSGPNSTSLCIRLYYSTANCSGDVHNMSSVAVFNCRNSQVLYTIIIDNNDTRCSEVTTQMDHTTGHVVHTDAVNSGSHTQTVQVGIGATATCIFCSLLFFSLGYLCHRYCQRKRHPVADQQSPVYDEVHVLQRRQSEKIEVTKNKAYGPLSLQ